MAKRVEDPAFEQTLYRYIDLSDLDVDSPDGSSFDLDALLERNPEMVEELSASLREADEGRLIPHEDVVRRWRASRGQG